MSPPAKHRKPITSAMNPLSSSSSSSSSPENKDAVTTTKSTMDSNATTNEEVKERHRKAFVLLLFDRRSRFVFFGMGMLAIFTMAIIPWNYNDARKERVGVNAGSLRSPGSGAPGYNDLPVDRARNPATTTTTGDYDILIRDEEQPGARKISLTTNDVERKDRETRDILNRASHVTHDDIVIGDEEKPGARKVSLTTNDVEQKDRETRDILNRAGHVITDDDDNTIKKNNADGKPNDDNILEFELHDDLSHEQVDNSHLLKTDTTAFPLGKSRPFPSCAECIAYYPSLDLSDHIKEDVSLHQMFNFLNAEPLQITRNKPPLPAEQLVVARTANAASDNALPAQLGIITRQGSKMGANGHIFNQDRIVIIRPFLPSVPESFYIGIFDGHGALGHVVAQHAVEQLAATIFDRVTNAATMPTEEEIGVMLTEVFRTVDRTAPPNAASMAGCTASIALRLSSSLGSSSSKIYFANTGDSLSFLAGGATGSILHETAKHKPHLPLERMRVEQAGGFVILPPDGADMEQSRVFVPDGSEPGMGVALAMSRSLGDWSAAKVGVIPDPGISSYAPTKLGESATIVVVASDGLFDRIPPVILAQRLTTERGSLSLESICEQLVREASDSWKDMGIMYRDDISIAVLEV